MQYTPFGDTGIELSRLGFGAMRLPMRDVDGESLVNDDLAIPMMRRAFELGVNYIDTALFYCNGQSEIAVGKALKGWRDKVYLSSKYPIGDNGGYRKTLEQQLTKLDTDHIDFYHFHGIGEGFLTHPKRDELLADAVKANEEGLVRNIAFSFHDKPEAMNRLVDLGVFKQVLCQYNLLDRANEDALAYAQSKGLRTVVMGPVGGGRLGGMDPEAAARYGVTVKSSAELALRFVLANPNVDCALSGMSEMSHVEENAAVASNPLPLSEAERDGIEAATKENARLAELYCTGCDYCVPHCPEEVNIPRIFRAMNEYRVYGFKEHAQQLYDEIGRNDHVKGFNAMACVECGTCEEYCPQALEIMEQLKECREVFHKA